MNGKTKTVPLTCGNFVVGEADVEIFPGGKIAISARITDALFSERLTGQPTNNLVFRSAAFSILETS